MPRENLTCAKELAPEYGCIPAQMPGRNALALELLCLNAVQSEPR